MRNKLLAALGAMLLVSFVVGFVFGVLDNGKDGGTRLEMVVFQEGATGSSYVRSIDCSSRYDDKICDRLSKYSVQDFQTSPGPCTLIYGGPEVVLLHGELSGQEISTRFNRTNSCEIKKWDKFKFLFQIPENPVVTPHPPEEILEQLKEPHRHSHSSEEPDEHSDQLGQ